MTTTYADFLAAKADFRTGHGFTVDPGDVHPMLLPHQRDIVVWACAGGRRAVFAAFGLGKTVIQLETMRLSLRHLGSDARGLIVCPLGVRGEFAHDAAMLGMAAPTFIRRTEQIDGPGLFITNYESVRDGRLDPNAFDAVSLDEAGVLRSFGSKTYQSFLGMFDKVPMRFVATATPSPNRYKELIHYAGFLGVMDTGQALTRFFQRDSTKANNLTLYPHKEREFWLWLNTWAAFVSRPSDLGYDDTGYDLPPVEIRTHIIGVDHSEAAFERDGQGQLLRDAAGGVTQAAREKRATLTERVAAAVDIAADTINSGRDDQVIIWCDLNDEQTAIERGLTAAGITVASIHGSLDLDEQERRLNLWRSRERQVLIGKPVMLGQGMNLQQSRTAIFAGVTYKFNDTIQAVHRIHRFGQTRECVVHVIMADSERSVWDTLREKWAAHDALTGTMSDVVREFGLDADRITEALTRSMGVTRAEASGESWTVAHNDCVDETTRMDADSVGLIVTSIPFSNHYEYTPSYNDFGHTDDNGHFWQQMDYLTPQLLRILQPGRIYACHVKDRILFGNATGKGVPTVSPFHAEAIMHSQRHGFDYLGMITVVTDVVRENNQTYRLGWTEQCKDGSKMGVGSPEYVLLFRKPQTDRSRGYADMPVSKQKTDYTRARWQVDAHSFWRSSGNRQLTAEDLAGMGPDKLAKAFTAYSMSNTYDYDFHIRIGEELEARGALPSTFMSLAPGSHDPAVWHDINRMLTLNGSQSQKGLQNHVCPLQFDIVDRLIERYSNPGETVYDPFGGLMTVPYRAILKGRKGRASELNTGYFFDGVQYLRAAEREVSMPSLFDGIEMEEAA